MAGFYSTFLLFAGWCVLINASRVQLESSRSHAPSMWKATDGASKNQKIQLTFALKQHNMDILEKRVLAMSTPTSSSYGKQMTLQEINALTHPGNDVLNSVKSFLNPFAIQDLEYSSGFLRFMTTVSEAEKILSTDYINYKHASGLSVFRCHNYSLPEEVAKLVSFVAPTINFPRPKPVNRQTFAAVLSSSTCAVDLREAILTPKSKASISVLDDNNANTYVNVEAEGVTYWQTLLSASTVDLTLNRTLGNENVTFHEGLSIELMMLGPDFYQILLNGNVTDMYTSYTLYGVQVGTVRCSPKEDDDTPVVIPPGECAMDVTGTTLTPNSVASISITGDQNSGTYVYLDASGRRMWTGLLSTSSSMLFVSFDTGNDVVTFKGGLKISAQFMGNFYQILMDGTIIDNGTTYNIVGKQLGTVNCNHSYFTNHVAVEAPFRSVPDQLRALYGINDVQGSGNVNNRQAFTGFLDQHFLDSDLQSFYNDYFPTLSGHSLYKIVGPNPAPAGIEASLDVQYLTALGSNVLTEFWSFPGAQPENPENEPFLDWLYLLGNTTDVPYVFSNSYAEDEGSVSMDYATRMNEEFLKGSARGITFLFGSGDWGVGSAFGECTTFTPMFPADSPYVTAVGATTNSKPEVAASLSGGGFSTRWAQPEWQTNAVTTYLSTATGLPSASLYNVSGRALPDIAAQGTNFAVINNGVTFPTVAGTSASTPVIGGIIALVNDARIGAGKAPMGLLNPFIYQFGSSIFTDVVSGNNPGCGTDGFQAAAEWDPVTGWGTIDFDKLLAAALSLP